MLINLKIKFFNHFDLFKGFEEFFRIERGSSHGLIVKLKAETTSLARPFEIEWGGLSFIILDLCVAE